MLLLSSFATAQQVGSDFRSQRFFNIVQYGAKNDGRRITDGAMGATTTTFTSATAGFTAADVGKAIRIPAAGTSGHDLVTTIAGFTNSTTVTLTASSVGAVSAKQVVYGTDNTAAIQRAIWADSANGGGTVWIPRGVFVVSGALVTSAFGGNPNSQIYFPTCPTGVPNFYNRTHYVIEGEAPPNFIPLLFATDTLASLSGSVIYSLIDGSGNLPAVFGTKSGSGFGNFNFNYFTFKNLSVFVAQNISNGGPSMGCINMFYSASVICDHVLACADGSIGRSVQPTNEVAGIISSGNSSEIQSEFNNIEVGNFKYGLVVADDALINNAMAVICQYAFVFPSQVENIQANYLKAYWCNNDIYVPNATIGGYITAGTTYFKVNNLVTEVFSASGNWYDYSFIVNDAGNRAVADISYTVIHAGVAWDNTLFNQTGGTGIQSRAIGSTVTAVPVDLGGYYTGGPALHQGDLTVQSNNTTNTFVGFNTSIVGVTSKATKTGPAAKLSFSSGGGIFMSSAASVTAGSTQTFSFLPFFMDNIGHVQIGNNVDFTPLAWLDLMPSTTGNAALNFHSGVDPTTPNAADIWNNSGVLKFKTLHLAPAITVTNDLGTASLAWRDIYFSHEVGKTAIGVSSGLGTNVSSLTPAGNDVNFTLTVVTSANVSGTVGLVAFGRTWGATPTCTISVRDATAGAAVIGGYVGLNATSGSSMTMTGALTGAGTYVFNCHCGQ